MMKTAHRSALASTLAALALAAAVVGCNDDRASREILAPDAAASAPGADAKTYDQIEFLGNPLVSEVTIVKANHDAYNKTQPYNTPQFRPQTRDLYTAPGDIGFWQGALRDPTDPQYEQMKKAVETRQPVTIDLLYGDYEGGQRVQTRFGLVARPRKDDKPDEDVWLASVSLHHNVDRPDPREAPQGFDDPAV